MMIQVVLKNGIRDTVPDYLLGMMMAAGEVISIRRSAGWVRIGVDAVRKGEDGYCYFGPERRKLNQQRLCLSCPHYIEGECTSDVCSVRYIQLRNYTKQ